MTTAPLDHAETAPEAPESEPISTESDEIATEETYAHAIETYLREATWLVAADAPFKVHARTVAKSLDRQMATKGEVQSALASTFAKVLLLLDKRRPGPAPIDPLTQGVGPHGEASIFGLPLDG